MKKVRWEEMFPDELLEVIREHPVCYMAYGLTEPHGAYGALGLDWLKAYALCEKVAEEYGGVLAPPMCWHVQEHPRFDWPRINGVEQSLCSSLPSDLFLRIVLHQLRVFDVRGFQVAILVTGHYGGTETDMRLLCDFYRRRSGSPMQIYCIADWECIDYGDYKGDHAGMTETQQLMALRPDLVDLNRKEPSPESGPWCGTDFPGIGKTPTREEGEGIIDSQVKNLGRIQQEMLAAYRPAENWTPPNQDIAEEMWQTFERVTRKYWVMSTCLEEYPKGILTFPGWEQLGL